METKKKLIYYIEVILNIIVSLVALVQASILLSKQESTTINIIFICISALFLVISFLYLWKLIKKEFISPLLFNILTLVMAFVALTCFILMLVDFKLIFFIIFVVEFIFATILQTFAMNYDDGKIRYNHVKRASRKSPTCTIQISTEYLVKDSYTPEEAEKTLNQLYSIHNNDGFSMEEYEKIKVKILKYIKPSD